MGVRSANIEQVTATVMNWGGVNSFFLHTLSNSDRAAHLTAMQASGMKVLVLSCVCEAQLLLLLGAVKLTCSVLCTYVLLLSVL